MPSGIPKEKSIKCLECEKEFKKSNNNQKYCNSKCRGKKWKRDNKYRLINYNPEKECEYCGKKYRGYGKRFCSHSCSTKGKDEKWRKKISKANSGDNNGMWKGDKVSYQALHNWIRTHKIKPEFCEECKKNKPYDLANISGRYKRDTNDFKWLCRSCHMKFDYENGIRKVCCLNCGSKIIFIKKSLKFCSVDCYKNYTNKLYMEIKNLNIRLKKKINRFKELKISM